MTRPLTVAAYTYRATVVRVIDADSVSLDMDLGFWITVRMTCRLSGLNCREASDPGGKAATTWLKDLLPVGTKTVVRSLKPDKYAGRFDGLISLSDGRDASTELIRAGYAAPWDGKGVRPLPAWPIPAVPSTFTDPS